MGSAQPQVVNLSVSVFLSTRIQVRVFAFVREIVGDRLGCRMPSKPVE